MHGRLCRRKPARNANALRHSVHADVLRNLKNKKNEKNVSNNNFYNFVALDWL